MLYKKMYTCRRNECHNLEVNLEEMKSRQAATAQEFATLQRDLANAKDRNQVIHYIL